jgi:hypothetical protein
MHWIPDQVRDDRENKSGMTDLTSSRWRIKQVRDDRENKSGMTDKKSGMAKATSSLAFFQT